MLSFLPLTYTQSSITHLKEGRDVLEKVIELLLMFLMSTSLSGESCIPLFHVFYAVKVYFSLSDSRAAISIHLCHQTRKAIQFVHVCQI